MGEVSVRIKPVMEIKGDYARICFRIGRRSFEEYMGENQKSTGMHHEDLAKQKYNTAKHRIHSWNGEFSADLWNTKSEYVCV